jgi:hypothetical protein
LPRPIIVEEPPVELEPEIIDHRPRQGRKGRRK